MIKKSAIDEIDEKFQLEMDHIIHSANKKKGNKYIKSR
jgi:hypothetical protein